MSFFIYALLMQLSTDRQRIQHLLRRAGFGYSRDELEEFVSLDYEGTVSYLLNFEAVDDSVVEVESTVAAGDLGQGQKNDRGRMNQSWNIRLAKSQRSLLEKMTYFWHDHFSTSIDKVGNTVLMQTQNNLLRKHALGNFGELLMDITRDGAMLKYLDNRLNRKGKPNENYARELMELYTLGEGNLYTELDIAEGARALTGWRLKENRDSNGVVSTEIFFNPRVHDPYLKTFLGFRGNLNDESLVKILCELPETADFLGKRLWEFFAIPNPTNKQIARTTSAYLKSNGSIKEVVRTILLSDEMVSDEAYRWRFKAPVEFVMGALRSLEVETSGALEHKEMRSMGQELFAPPSPAGWPGGEEWINSNSVLARSNFANNLTSAQAPFSRQRPVNLEKTFTKYGAEANASDAIEFLLDLLVGGDVDDETRELLVEHIGGSRHYNFEQAIKTGMLNQAVYLALTMPLNQLS